MPSTETRPISVKLEARDHERLKSLAEARHRKPHYLMKEALSQYLDREEKREAFRREAMDNWQEHRETGLHLTGKEVADWLDTWGTEAETFVSALCHQKEAGYGV